MKVRKVEYKRETNIQQQTLSEGSYNLSKKKKKRR